jgi:hypothetical protein
MTMTQKYFALFARLEGDDTTLFGPYLTHAAALIEMQELVADHASDAPFEVEVTEGETIWTNGNAEVWIAEMKTYRQAMAS